MIVRWIGRKIVGKIEDKRMEKLKKSKYNREYIEIRGEEIPRYLEDRRKPKERNIIARFRVGNEMRARQHWAGRGGQDVQNMQGERRKYGACLIQYECKETIGDNQLILNEEGKGADQMRRILEKRKKAEGGEEKNRAIMCNNI